MSGKSVQDPWEYVCLTTSSPRPDSTPPVWFDIVLRYENNQIILKPGLAIWIMVFIFANFLAFSLCSIFYMISFHSLVVGIASLVVFYPLSVYIMYRHFICIKNIRWNACGSTLNITYYQSFSKKCLNLPRDQFEPSLIFEEGYAKLLLIRKEKPNLRLVVAALRDKSSLVPIFDKLHELAEREGLDLTQEQFHLRDGRFIMVPKFPVRTSPKTMQVVTSDKDKFILKRTRSDLIKGIPLAIFSFSMIIAACVLYHRMIMNIWLCSLACLLFGIFFIISFSMFIRSFLTAYLVADRATNSLTIQPLLGFLGNKKYLCKLSDIDALQICGFYYYETNTRFCHELNVVFGNPDCLRITIFSDFNIHDFLATTQAFTEFTGAQLLNHLKYCQE